MGTIDFQIYWVFSFFLTYTNTYNNKILIKFYTNTIMIIEYFIKGRDVVHLDRQSVIC